MRSSLSIALSSRRGSHNVSHCVVQTLYADVVSPSTHLFLIPHLLCSPNPLTPPFAFVSLSYFRVLSHISTLHSFSLRNSRDVDHLFGSPRRTRPGGTRSAIGCEWTAHPYQQASASHLRQRDRRFGRPGPIGWIYGSVRLFTDIFAICTSVLICCASSDIQ